MDRHLMAQADAEAQLDEEFNERVCELLNDEWSPDKFSNLVSAFENDALFYKADLLENALKSNDFSEFGWLIFKQIEAYCISQAEDQANYEFSKGLN